MTTEFFCSGVRSRSGLSLSIISSYILSRWLRTPQLVPFFAQTSEDLGRHLDSTLASYDFSGSGDSAGRAMSILEGDETFGCF